MSTDADNLSTELVQVFLTLMLHVLFMIYGLIDNEKTMASPKAKAVCQFCDAALISKCGEIKIWHWAHKHKCSDNWYEPETDWHFYWKMAFGKENTEVIIRKEEKKHIADIYTKEEIVIELQNSAIQKPVIREREEFYGEKMIWIINGENFEDNFRVTRNEERFISDESFNFNEEFKQKYRKYKFSFYWSWARKSWNEVKRHTFIDFGGDKLFWVKEGMGTFSGYGKWIEKIEFFKKYGGDYVFFAEKQQEYKKKRDELRKIEMEKMYKDIKAGIDPDKYAYKKPSNTDTKNLSTDTDV